MRTVSVSARRHGSLPVRFVGLALLLTGAACADDDPGKQPAIDPAAPIVRITSPARGAYVGDVSTVTITGRSRMTRSSAR